MIVWRRNDHAIWENTGTCDWEKKSSKESIETLAVGNEQA
jgi:hypothetical protein